MRTMNTLYCNKCGAPNSADAQFCSRCGGALNPVRAAHGYSSCFGPGWGELLRARQRRSWIWIWRILDSSRCLHH
ncbi:MAG: hypothetical protein DMG70_27115 [Acidobacteria bacterium]|nr:MAG: hypothetical protein DMG70_27115 [Acidobacteriota bacterium]PYY08463.1 MAG: hypothetical protein DMG69_14610 [Acidobacteriota bacterium]